MFFDVFWTLEFLNHRASSSFSPRTLCSGKDKHCWWDIFGLNSGRGMFRAVGFNFHRK